MAMIKLTKNELRGEQNRLQLLYKYLPTLQLKKAMLQTEVSESKTAIESLQSKWAPLKSAIESFSSVLSDLSFDMGSAIKIKEVKKRYENSAGVEIPYFEEVLFEPFEYSLMDTPVWVDAAISSIQQLVILKEQISVAEEKKKVLEKELREIAIRVNLFEKILIPKTLENIKKIKVFLGDQQLAAVSRAKVAKAKIGRKACASM